MPFAAFAAESVWYEKAPKSQALKFQLGLNSGFGAESGLAAGLAPLSATTAGDEEPKETDLRAGGREHRRRGEHERECASETCGHEVLKCMGHAAGRPHWEVGRPADGVTSTPP